MTKHTKKYVCDSCGFRADDSSKLYYHKQVTHEAVMVPCPDCGKMFKDRYLKLHQRKVHNAAACEICGVVVKNVKHHMQGVHMADKDKRFHCKDCGNWQGLHVQSNDGQPQDELAHKGSAVPMPLWL